MTQMWKVAIKSMLNEGRRTQSKYVKTWDFLGKKQELPNRTNAKVRN